MSTQHNRGENGTGVCEMGGKWENILFFQTDFSGGNWKLRGGKGKEPRGQEMVSRFGQRNLHGSLLLETPLIQENEAQSV